MMQNEDLMLRVRKDKDFFPPLVLWYVRKVGAHMLGGQQGSSLSWGKLTSVKRTSEGNV